MTIVRKLASATAGALLLGVAATAGAQSIPETDDPIKLAMNEWTGQHISTAVAGQVLKRMGYNVEYVTAGYYPQVTAVADGDIHAALEVWSSNVGDAWDEHFENGSAVIVSVAALKPQEAWFVPAYVVDLCEGLPSWEALNDCTELFETADTAPSGRFLDYPADWGDSNVRRIEALGLDYVAIASGGEGSLITEIRSAVERQAPLILMFWEPHWIHAQVDLQRVYLPEYFDGCHDDASLGLNPDMTYDCDWAGAEIWKVANPGLKDSHPGAWNLIETYSITNADQAQMMSEIDDKNRDLLEVVDEWLDNNAEAVNSWIDHANM